MAKRQTDTSFLSSSSSCRLPEDILHHIRDPLYQEDQRATARSLAASNRHFYNTFISAVKYDRLKITAENARLVFWGLCPPETSSSQIDEIRGQARAVSTADVGGQTDYRVEESTPTTTLSVIPSSITHERKLGLLNKCTHLELNDIAALHHLIEAHRAADGKPFMPNVSHLILGKPLIYALGMAVDQHHHYSILKLGQILHPSHLCVHFSVGSQHDFMFRKFEMEPKHFECEGDLLEWMEHNDYIWKFQLTNGITDLVNSFERFWNMESITCHNISVQSIPTTVTPVHRIFYARESPPAAANLQADNLLEERARDIADAISLLGPPQEDYFELIGAGFALEEFEEKEDAWRFDDFCVHLIKDIIKDNLSPPNLWETIDSQILFTPCQEAEPCICCGGK